MVKFDANGPSGERQGVHPLVALHLGPEPGDVPGNLLLAEGAVTEAKRAHPALRWVVLPELFTSGYADLAGVHRYAEDAETGPSAEFFVSLARRLGLYVAYGFPEKLRGMPGVSDSANLVGPRGVMLTYRKRHLVQTLGEPDIFVAGTRTPVVRAGGARIALVICWDLGFPEVVRGAALEGADLVLAPPDGGTHGDRSTIWSAPPAPWTTPFIWRAPTSSGIIRRRPSAIRAASTARTAAAYPGARAPRASAK